MKFASQIVLIGAVVAAVVAGAVLLVRQSPTGGEIEIVLATATPAPEIDLRVYISGAVRNPGVYGIGEGGRLEQVIEAAGGAAEDADLTSVNLAVRVKDEDHWHVPRVGESPQTSSAQASAQPAKVDINTADVELLKTLPGIGEVKAQSIVRYRQTKGPFSRVEDLLEVSGIGPATLDAIQDLVDVR